MFKNLLANSMDLNICEKLQYLFGGYLNYSYSKDLSDKLLSEYHEYKDDDDDDDDRSPITKAPGVHQEDV